MKKINKRTFISILSTAFVACMLPKAQASDTVPANELALDDELTKLSSMNKDELLNLANAFDKRNKQLLHALIEQLSVTSSSDDVKFYAIYFLGELRLRGAVSELIENINLRDGDNARQNHFAPWLWGIYPAVDALIKIGTSATSRVIDVLKTSDDALTRSLCLDVLHGIYNGDNSVVRLVLQNSTAKETDPTIKSHIQNAIDAVKA